MTMARSATNWHKTADPHGRTILYITSDECTVADTALCSVQDPMSDLPSRRMVRGDDGWIRRDLDAEDGPYPALGLIVYGCSKFDRPDLGEVYMLDRVAARAIAADIAERHDMSRSTVKRLLQAARDAGGIETDPRVREAGDLTYFSDRVEMVKDGALITGPRDPRLLDVGSYGALTVTAETLRGIMRTAGEYGAKIVNAADFAADGDTASIPRGLMQETVRDMLATGSGERFPMPDGGHELVVLRFVVDRVSLSIVYVEDYDPSCPALVDGHLIDRDKAITAWLGDTDGSEHPGLFQPAAWQRV